MLCDDRRLDVIRASTSIAEQIRQQAQETQAEPPDPRAEDTTGHSLQAQNTRKTTKQISGARQLQREITHRPFGKSAAVKRKSAGSSAWASAKAFAQPKALATAEARGGMMRRPLAPIQEREQLKPPQGKGPSFLSHSRRVLVLWESKITLHCCSLAWPTPSLCMYMAFAPSEIRPLRLARDLHPFLIHSATLIPEDKASPNHHCIFSLASYSVCLS